MTASVLMHTLMTAALACSALPATSDAEPRAIPYKVTTTIGMVGDIVRQVTGDRATVVNIIGEGVDPHLYNATRADIGKLLEADIVFYSGLMLEGKMADALIRVARKRAVYAVTELIDPALLLEPPEFAGHPDPHLWMDVRLWRTCTEMVSSTLSAFDPDGASIYKANCARYIAELDELDSYVRKVIGSIPESRRVLVTAHDAFNYMAKSYGLEVIGIQGISTESEAGVDDINRIVDLLVRRRIEAVFVETSVSDKNMRALIEGAASHGHTVKIGGALFSDAMGAPGTYEGTYIGMIDHNATTIARALGGDAPERGLRGRLAIQTKHMTP